MAAPKPNLSLNFSARETLTLNPDPRTPLADSEVTKILHLKTLAERLLDEFTNSIRITRNLLLGTGSSPLTILPKKRRSEALAPSEPQTNLVHLKPSDFVQQSFSCDETHLDLDPLTLDEAKSRPNWPQWLIALQTKYASLRKHHVFGPLVTNLSRKPIGFKLIFTKKKSPEGLVIRYKVRLVAKGFS